MGNSKQVNYHKFNGRSGTDSCQTKTRDKGLFVGWPRDVNNVSSTQRKQRESIGQEQTPACKQKFDLNLNQIHTNQLPQVKIADQEQSSAILETFCEADWGVGMWCNGFGPLNASELSAQEFEACVRSGC
ncbi:MAG: hypothetical protein OIF58_04840, partial [Cohaesibacter sp.]|nr:hypothetical protein [Cohaesibacter sp.]